MVDYQDSITVCDENNIKGYVLKRMPRLANEYQTVSLVLETKEGYYDTRNIYHPYRFLIVITDPTITQVQDTYNGKKIFQILFSLVFDGDLALAESTFDALTNISRFKHKQTKEVS